MSDITERRLYINEYPEYGLVLQCIIELFLQEKEKNKKEKGKDRITLLSDIDEEIAYLFNTNSVYAGKLRKVYCSGGNRKADFSEKYLREGSIEHFNFGRLKSVFKRRKIEISDEICDKLLRLSTLALPVSEILNKESKFEIHTEVKVKIEEWKHEIDLIMETRQSLKVSLLKYLHHFRENELVWWLFTSLPSVKEEKVEHWIDSFGNIPSEKTILELIDSAEKCGYLLDFKNKFYRINEKNHKNVYDDITGFDLLFAYVHIDNFKQLACTPLRPVDIYLTYLITATIKQCPRELILERIAADSKAKIAFNFAPTEEIIVDWATQTYI